MEHERRNGGLTERFGVRERGTRMAQVSTRRKGGWREEIKIGRGLGVLRGEALKDLERGSRAKGDRTASLR